MIGSFIICLVLPIYIFVFDLITFLYFIVDIFIDNND